MSSRCLLTELLVDQCGHCNQTKSRPAAAPAGAAAHPEPAARATWQDLVDARQGDRPGWHPARSRGQCAICAHLYAVGVLVTADEVTGGWIAECCDPNADPADAIPGGEVPDGSDLWARLLAKVAGLGRAA